MIVVLVGLIPTLIGGPVFALVMIALGVAGFREYLELVTRIGPFETGSVQAIGYGVVAALGLVALLGHNEVVTIRHLRIGHRRAPCPVFMAICPGRRPRALVAL